MKTKPANKKNISSLDKYETKTTKFQLPHHPLLAFTITLLFTSLSLFPLCAEETLAPNTVPPSVGTCPSSNIVDGGGNGDSPTPCSADKAHIGQLMNVTKGVSAMAEAERGATTSSDANPQILVVVRDIMGNENYTKVEVTGKSRGALTATDCLKRLAPGTYTVVATSHEDIVHKTIWIK